MNELTPVLQCRQPAIVEDNLVDLQQRVMTVMQTVDALPRERNSLPTVRSVRAELSRYFQAMETQRKLVKAAVMLPYTEAENRYKELVKKPIDEADAKCRAFISEVETAVKSACEAELRDYFTELCSARGIHWLKFERVGISVTLAMADQKELRKPRERILAFVNRVDSDLQTLSGMEGSADLLMEYEQCMDVAEAIRRVNARNQAKAAAEESHKAYAQAQSAKAQAAQRIADAVPEAAKVVYQQEKKYRVTFSIVGTVPQLRGLKAFLDGNHYEYQEVTDNGE